MRDLEMSRSRFDSNFSESSMPPTRPARSNSGALPSKTAGSIPLCRDLGVFDGVLLSRAALGILQLRLAKLARFALGLADHKSSAALIFGLVEFIVCHSGPF